MPGRQCSSRKPDRPWCAASRRAMPLVVEYSEATQVAVFEAEVELHVARHLKGMIEEEQAALAWLQNAAINGER